MKINKKPTLQEYDNGWEEEAEILPTGLLELGEMIDEKLLKAPERKNKIASRIWVKEANRMINEYNTRVGWKCYKNVH